MLPITGQVRATIGSLSRRTLPLRRIDARRVGAGFRMRRSGQRRLPALDATWACLPPQG
jgi:hypothetical protein